VLTLGHEAKINGQSFVVNSGAEGKNYQPKKCCYLWGMMENLTAKFWLLSLGHEGKVGSQNLFF
jgi:hypothetical protein